jgi:hypothetical protein
MIDPPVQSCMGEGRTLFIERNKNYYSFEESCRVIKKTGLEENQSYQEEINCEAKVMIYESYVGNWVVCFKDTCILILWMRSFI